MEAKKLFEILKDDQLVNAIESYHGVINALVIDSRKIQNSDCFFAIKGLKFDGHDFIDAVISNGAKVIICEKMPDDIKGGISYYKVKDVRLAMARLAHRFYDDPSSKMKVIGVTGTNGKTTITTLLYQLFSKLGYTCGLLSTVENRVGDAILPATHTTPDSISIASLMAKMYDAGCSHIFMEVSSHALDQKRTIGINFKTAVFTNITHDHLDYHKTFLEYIKAKKSFFDSLDSSSFAIINEDDKNGKVMVQNCKAKMIGYALHTMTDYHCKILSNDISGLHLKINNEEAMCLMAGEFNAYNISATLAAAISVGENGSEVLSIVSGLNGAEGRMEKVIDRKNEKVGIVDYAHTPDALENVLTTIKASLKDGQKIITVVGCGGDRDATKRPLMAEIGAKLSDKIVLTSDNPRTEDPEIILDQMEKGLSEALKSKCLRITDRLMAIKTACLIASPGDVILVAGKGHEKYQEINGIKLPFEDKKILSEIFSGNI